jgi:hypothetical protein
MGLAEVIDAFATYLESALDPAPALVGGAYPRAAAELPAVVMSVASVREQLRGLGRLPAPTASGALPVTAEIDLAHPVATFPDAVVPLLSNDRKTLSLPHGPLVAADGTTTAFGSSDLQAHVGATTFTVVGDAPAAGEVQPDPDLGVLRFGSPLPAAGTLDVSYFVGEWEVRVERYQGDLLVETFAGDAAGVENLSRAVEAALLDQTGPPLPGLNRIEQTSWQPVAEAGTTHAAARGRALGFAFDYELVQPHLGGGGGVISTVNVSSTFGAEHFDVQREGSTP